MPRQNESTFLFCSSPLNTLKLYSCPRCKRYDIEWLSQCIVKRYLLFFSLVLFIYLLSFQYRRKYRDKPNEEKQWQCLEIIQVLDRFEISNSKTSLDTKKKGITQSFDYIIHITGNKDGERAYSNGYISCRDETNQCRQKEDMVRYIDYRRSQIDKQIW